MPVVAEAHPLTLSNNISTSKECNIRASAYIPHLKRRGVTLFPVKELLGVAVDVLTPSALPDKFREQFILEAQPV